MAVTPYTIFSVFPSGGDPLIRAWTKFREEIQAGSLRQERAAAVAVPDSTFDLTVDVDAVMERSGESGIWRLLASNNREIARSSFLYRSFLSAREHLLRLQPQAGEMVTNVVQGSKAGTHGWYVSLRGVTVMTCSRWYCTATVSREAAAAAVLMFARATVADLPGRSSRSVDRARLVRPAIGDGQLR